MHRRKILIAAGAVVALLSLLFLVAACSSDDNGDADPTATEPAVEDPTATETSVDVSIAEWAIEPSVDSVPAGTVTFNVSSNGAIFHNLRVVATDLAPSALPTDAATFGVDESQLDVVGSTAQLDPGDTEDLTLDLEAGSYVLICNVPTHYDIGMFVAFTVE